MGNTYLQSLNTLQKSLDFIKGQIYALMINASEDTAYEQGFVDGLRKVYEMIENEL